MPFRFHFTFLLLELQIKLVGWLVVDFDFYWLRIEKSLAGWFWNLFSYFFNYVCQRGLPSKARMLWFLQSPFFDLWKDSLAKSLSCKSHWMLTESVYVSFHSTSSTSISPPSSFFWGQTFYVLAFQAIEAVMLSLASFLSACFVIEWPKDSGCMRLCQGPYSHYLKNQGRTTTTTVNIIASWQNDSGYCKAICVLPLPSFEFVIISWSMILRFIDLSPRGEVGCGGVGRWAECKRQLSVILGDFKCQYQFCILAMFWNFNTFSKFVYLPFPLSFPQITFDVEGGRGEKKWRDIIATNSQWGKSLHF